MHAYDRCPPDIVKSVQQRWLLTFWAKKRNGAALPNAGAFDADTIESCRDDLTILDVLPHNGADCAT